ncbi:MAG: hypothetical protein JWO58_390, partial [Chitinophagaceae bacterium]|nr:hypothetical protein [Chitinophagaceae bacterium]
MYVKEPKTQISTLHMKTNFAFLALLFAFTFINPVNAQQKDLLTPEEKAQQAAIDMQKRLGLKETQIEKIYTLNLTKIQQVRTVKSQQANLKKLGRDYKEISESYNTKLRSVLTPEQYQRWEILKNEAQNRRMIRQKHIEKEPNDQADG